MCRVLRMYKYTGVYIYIWLYMYDIPLHSSGFPWIQWGPGETTNHESVKTPTLKTKLPPRHMGTKSCVWWSTRSTCPRYSPKQRPNLRKSLFSESWRKPPLMCSFAKSVIYLYKSGVLKYVFWGKDKGPQSVLSSAYLYAKMHVFINRGYAHQSRNLWIWDVRMASKCTDFKSLKTLTTDINHGNFCLWLE